MNWNTVWQHVLKQGFSEHQGIQSVKHLPSAQVMILRSWDPGLHRNPYSTGSWLLPLPLLLPSLSNKYIKCFQKINFKINLKKIKQLFSAAGDLAPQGTYGNAWRNVWLM